jgi:hypothetical protein
VDSLVDEMKSGKPRPLPDHDLVGGTPETPTPLRGE